MEAVLSTMAGVSSKNEMSTQYMVRGGSYDENSVYINGIEIYRPQLISSGQQEGLSIINPDLVGAVNFSTGGFSAAYGDKMSSALDITYREPEAFEGAVSMSLQGGSVAIGQSSNRFSQIHGFRYKRNSSLCYCGAYQFWEICNTGKCSCWNLPYDVDVTELYYKSSYI